jgi:hypothetical protein
MLMPTSGGCTLTGINQAMVMMLARPSASQHVTSEML